MNPQLNSQSIYSNPIASIDGDFDLISRNDIFQSEPQLNKIWEVPVFITPLYFPKIGGISSDMFSSEILNISNLNSYKYALSQPISLIASFENNIYYVASMDFDIFGEGKELGEAISNFKINLITFFESLKNNYKILGHDLLEKFTILNSLINEK